MVLFPIALLWVAAVLFWVIRKYAVDPDAPDEQPPRRFARPPRDPGRGPTGAATAARKGSRPPAPHRRGGPRVF